MEKSVHTPEYGAVRAELRTARANAGLAQRELAQRLGVPHSWVAKVETGERRIDLVEFCRFLCECDVDPVEASARVVARIRKSGHSRRSKGA